MRVEICVQSLGCALEAQAGGADRVELCEYLAVGGVTPGPGVIRRTCELLQIPVHVLVRPRGGPFVHNADELGVMEEDIAYCKERGAAGVVIGVLGEDGRIDGEATARLVAAARPMAVTFHKAFDELREPFEGLETLMELGIERVLTSGGGRSARDGAGRLEELQRRAGERLTVLAGGGVRVADVELLRGAGMREIHAGSAAGPAGGTRAALVEELVRAAR